MHKNKVSGLKGENEAVIFLQNKGYKIIERNFLCKLGEIDIIAESKNTLCFIEVKTYSQNNYADVYRSITKSKQKKIIASTKYYIAKKNITDKNIRFDAIFITGKELEHITGAFFI